MGQRSDEDGCLVGDADCSGRACTSYSFAGFQQAPMMRLTVVVHPCAVLLLA